MNPFLYRMRIQYRGAGFNGWQSQLDKSGVQDALEAALKTILNRSVRITGASRTDSGVHAYDQAASFSLDSEIDCRKLLISLNAILPSAIGVRSLDPVASEFHPIYSAKAKVYRYALWRSRLRHPFLEDYVHRVSDQIELAPMREAAKFFEGTFDFSSFCASDSSAKTRIRTVHAIRISDHGDLIELWFFGAGFLKQMIRTMVGTLLDVGLGKLKPEGIKTILDAKDRSKAGATAPAQGLCLMKVCYEEHFDLDNLSSQGFFPPF